MIIGISYVLPLLVVIIAATMFARWIADRCGQPSVLLELLIGVMIGNIGYFLGCPLFVIIMHFNDAETIIQQEWTIDANVEQTLDSNPSPNSQFEQPSILQDILSTPESVEVLAAAMILATIAQLGVLLLLFVAGLESDVRKMEKFWRPSLGVAIAGVVLPFALGFAVCLWLHIDMSIPGHLFLAATLAATSVGITARVFEDLKQLHRREVSVILGAAVIDDILGLILLAIVVGISTTGIVNAGEIAKTIIIAIAFIFIVLKWGEWLATKGAKFFYQLDPNHSRLLYPLCVAFGLAWFAEAIHLAAIVGAFAAGLVISDRQFSMSDDSKMIIQQHIAPLERFLAPIFFLMTGMQVNLTYFMELQTLWLAIAFTVAAVVGKVIAGLFAGSDFDRLTIGLGMVPRGEVGLIFIGVGRGLGVVEESIFSALVVVVIITTLMTPPSLKWSLCKNEQSTF